MDGGALLFLGVCALATVAVVPSAIVAATVFGAPPRGYVAAYGVPPRRAFWWGGPYASSAAPYYGDGSAAAAAPAPGFAYVRVPVPRDGAEYYVVRADTFDSAPAEAREGAHERAPAEGCAPAPAPPSPPAPALQAEQ
jgi:hypothetical protein